MNQQYQNKKGLLDRVDDVETSCKHFSPIVFDGFYDVVCRSKLILNARTPQEIDLIEKDIKAISDEYSEVIEDTICDIWDKGEKAISRFSNPRTLWLCIDIVDLSGRTAISSPTWQEYMAVCALERFVMFGKMVEKVSCSGDQIESMEQHWSPDPTLFFADAVEAVVLAEGLATDPDGVSQLKDEIRIRLQKPQSERSSKAAQVRHQDTNSLLNALVEFYDAGSFKSYRQAVVEFLQQTPEIHYKHLAPTNRLRTLAEGLSAVKRGKRKLY
jgi:hypothetical protein